MSVLAHHRHEQPVRHTRECLGLLLKVLNEHDPGVLEDLVGVARREDLHRSA